MDYTQIQAVISEFHKIHGSALTTLPPLSTTLSTPPGISISQQLAPISPGFVKVEGVHNTSVQSSPSSRPTSSSLNNLLPTQPNSRSAADVAIALYSFLNYLKQQPPMPEPNPLGAQEASRYLNTLRHSVIVGGLPQAENAHVWIPLDQDPAFMKYHQSLVTQSQLQTTSHSNYNYDNSSNNNILSTSSSSVTGSPTSHPSTLIHPIDPQTLYIPPLFSQLELESQTRNHNGYYNPITNPYHADQSPLPPTLFPPSTPTPQPVPQPNIGSPTISPSSPSQRTQHYYSAITTNPLPTLRGLVWKAFVLGPLFINSINLGLVHISTLTPSIPPPYIAPAADASDSSFREGRQRDTSVIRGAMRTTSASTSVAPTHHDFVNRNFREEAATIDENDDGLSFSSSLDNQSTNSSIISTGTHSNSTTRQLNDSLHTTSSIGSNATFTPALSALTPPQHLHGGPNSVVPSPVTSTTATLTLTTRGLTQPKPLPDPTLFTSASDYFTILSHGQGIRYSMIRDDSFRTFRTDLRFDRLVPEQALIRVCNAFDLQYNDSNWKYCQGMNVYAGMFLYTMPELDAYNCFVLYCTQYIPYYWRSNHIGVEAGCAVLDLVLNLVDPALYGVLTKLNPKLFAILYAFSFVKTMSASASPLSEVVKLWDVQLAMGPFFNICCVAAQIISLKPQIIASSFPKSILDYRAWPQLDATKVTLEGLNILKQVFTRKDLLQKLQFHQSDPSIVAALAGRRP